MKILYLSVPYRLSSAKVKVGGGEISNRVLLEELALNNSVTVLSAYGSGVWKRKVNNVEVLDFSTLFRFFGPFSTLMSRFFSRALFFYYSFKVKPDVILCGPDTVSISVAISNKLKKPAGCFIRAFENFSIENNKDGFFKKALKFFLYGNNKAKAVNELDFLLPNSKYMLKRCMEEFACNSYHVVYPPISISESELFVPEEIKKIYMVSNSEHKGFALFKKLSEEFIDIEFYAVGVPGINEAIKISDNLYYEGWQANPESFISKSDVFLVPSLWDEPFGRISIEAILCGRIVFVSDRGGLPETVNNSSLFVVPSSDYIFWKERIKDLINDKVKYIKEYEMVRDNASEFVLRKQTESLHGFLLKINKNYNSKESF